LELIFTHIFGWPPGVQRHCSPINRLVLTPSVWIGSAMARLHVAKEEQAWRKFPPSAQALIPQGFLGGAIFGFDGRIWAEFGQAKPIRSQKQNNLHGMSTLQEEAAF
jgi:hypothetical protein